MGIAVLIVIIILTWKVIFSQILNQALEQGKLIAAINSQK